MKKTFSNIRTLAALLMAGAAFAACSSDENIIEQQPVDNGEQVYTLTIEATKGESATRALVLDNPSSPTSALHAEWTTTDAIAVLKGGSVVGSLTPSEISSDGQKAKFTGTLTGTVAETDVLTLAYNPVDNISAFALQDGTLLSAGHFDSATATVTVASIIDKGSSKDITISGGATFVTQTAVLKLTLANGTLPINATSLKMMVMGQEILTFAPAAAAYTTNGDGILYFSLPSKTAVATALASKLGMSASTVSTMLASSNITFIANDGLKTFTINKTGYPFEAAKYYAATLAMKECGSFYNITSSGTVNGTGVNESFEKQTLPFNTNIDALVGATALSGATVNSVTVLSGNAIATSSYDGSSITFSGAGSAVLSVNYTLGMGNSSDEITVTVMPVTLAEGHELTGAFVGDIVCNDGLAYSPTDKDNLPSGVSIVALVAYKGTGNGLAIGLSDLGSMDWPTAMGACSALNSSIPITGATWRVATQDEWNSMISGLGGWSIFKAVTSLSTDNYWSSTENGTQANETLSGSSGSWTAPTDWYTNCNTRAVLAW